MRHLTHCRRAVSQKTQTITRTSFHPQSSTSLLSNMPAKYSHIKKRTPNPKKNGKGSGNSSKQVLKHRHPHHPNPHADRSVTQAMSAVTQLERAISRILLLRYEQDIARLFSTRLHDIALVHLPTFVMRCVTLGGPSWAAHNADCEEIKDFFRAAISMDMRQAGERVATKSVLWSYTALRHFVRRTLVLAIPTDVLLFRRCQTM